MPGLPSGRGRVLSITARPLYFMKIKAPFTLEILCALCRGAVTLQMASTPLHAPADRQCWACPYCLKDNSGRFPYEVVWVEKRYPAES